MAEEQPQGKQANTPSTAKTPVETEILNVNIAVSYTHLTLPTILLV